VSAVVDPDDVVPRHDCPIDGRSGFVVVDGDRQVHYLEWGRSSAPPIVCLHGGGQTAYMFEELGASLREQYHVVAPDLPNHGDSDPLPPGVWDRPSLAEAVIPFLDEFGIERAVFVGASLGGLTSLSLGANHPDRLAGLVLIDIGHKVESEGVMKIVEFMRAHESFASLEDAAAFIGEYLPYRKSFRPESLTRNLRQRADGRWIWKHGMGRHWNRRVEEAGGELPEVTGVMAGVEDDARAVRCPTLVLRGGASDVLSGDTATELVELMADARLAIVEKAGHLAAGDNPRSTVNLISTFITDIGW
jgi:pimeloyl-ACP methyl ester carboxylesterase